MFANAASCKARSSFRERCFGRAARSGSIGIGIHANPLVRAVCRSSGCHRGSIRCSGTSSTTTSTARGRPCCHLVCASLLARTDRRSRSCGCDGRATHTAPEIGIARRSTWRTTGRRCTLHLPRSVVVVATAVAVGRAFWRITGLAGRRVGAGVGRRDGRRRCRSATLAGQVRSGARNAASRRRRRGESISTKDIAAFDFNLFDSSVLEQPRPYANLDLRSSNARCCRRLRAGVIVVVR